MIKDHSVCKPYTLPVGVGCEYCLCAHCFNHIPFGDCSLGFGCCAEDSNDCISVGFCSAFTPGQLAESVRSLR